jgi:hypothetical protein
VVEEEKEEALVAAPVIAHTPTPMPTATLSPTPVVVVYDEVKKEEPVNVSVAISAIPVAALLAATLLLYDPRPAQLKKLTMVAQNMAPDVNGLNTVISFVGGTLLSKKSDKEEGEK